MTGYYALYIASMLLSSLNTVYLYKKYQLTAGTSLKSNTMYMIINGVISALVPGILMAVRGQALEATPYSLIVATVIVSFAACNTMAQFKAYSLGKIATVNILGTMGTILLSCFWGVLVLHESLTFVDGAAIVLMLLSTLLIRSGPRDREGKGLLWLYIAIVLLGGTVSILSKQHQVETAYETVDTLSFSVWIGVIRVILFSFVAIYYLSREGKKAFAFPKSSVVYATASSVLSGSCYIITLFTGTILPIVITSPLGTGMSIVMCTLLPWVFYREKLSRRQIVGILFSLVGAILFLVG